LIEHLDWGVGRVLAALDEAGLDRNTLVIFTSDNGGSLQFGANNGSLRDGKGKTYEGGIRVPMVARWPGKIAPGSRSEVVAKLEASGLRLEAGGLGPEAGGWRLEAGGRGEFVRLHCERGQPQLSRRPRPALSSSSLQPPASSLPPTGLICAANA
jgi:hypothetical protein